MHMKMNRRDTHVTFSESPSLPVHINTLTSLLLTLLLTTCICMEIRMTYTLSSPGAALRKFRATPHIEADVEEMRAEIRAQQSEATMSMLQLLRSSSLRMPLCIAIVMQLSQQLSGINAVSQSCHHNTKYTYT